MSKEEILPLLNTEGEIIGEVPRSLANSEPGHIHPEVFILIVDALHRVLLQKRSATKKVLPNYWITSVAGHVTLGEDRDDVAHRELQEELGFDVPLTYVKQELHEMENETHMGYWYKGEYENKPIVLDESEGADAQFFSADEFQRLTETELVEKYSRAFIEEYFSTLR